MVFRDEYPMVSRLDGAAYFPIHRTVNPMRWLPLGDF
jgi:hypothetical protein